jgi:hypothetical protein
MYERWKNTEKYSDKWRKIKMMEAKRKMKERGRKIEKDRERCVLPIDIEVIQYLHTTY